MGSYSASSIPPNPTLRSSTLNTVIVVPLLSSTSNPSHPIDYNSHSYHSFQTLFSCLSDINLERRPNENQFRPAFRRHPSSAKGHPKYKQNAAVAAIKAASAPSNEITLVIPNSNLTPPSEFHYDSTPLKSHDWTMGCQRLLFLNGLHSIQAQDRYKSFANTSNTAASSSNSNSNSNTNTNSSSKRIPSHYGHFVDLYPSRGVSAVIGVINVKDCNSNVDFQKAERELEQWVLKFTPHLHYEKSFLGHGQSAADSENSSPMSPRHFITKRLFIFDSFDESCLEKNIVNMTNTRFTKPNEFNAFPPTENMNLHLNVVVNDLAVAIFMALERRIKVVDGLCDDDQNYIKKKGGNNSIASRTDSHDNDDEKEERSNVGAVLNLSFGSNDDDTNHSDAGSEGGEILKTHSNDDHYYTNDSFSSHGNSNSNSNSNSRTINKQASSSSLSLSNSGHNNKKVMSRGLKSLAASAVRALNKQNNNDDNTTEEQFTLPPIEHELQTPLDTVNFQGAEITAKDVEYICKRNAARRVKYTADLALLAGSVMDAYDRYTSAAGTLKSVHDPLWYAAAKEGIAATYVAMSDTGGHNADLYLERNFQYPDKVMEAAFVLSGVKTNEIYDSNSKVDKNKTTMPEAVTALLQEACDIMSHNLKLSSIYSELLLKMAWYISELEGVHLLCRWGEGFSGGNGQNDAYGVAMTAAISGQQKRWELTSVSKIDLKSLRETGKLDALLCERAVSQSRRFTETLHRTASNGGLDPYTRAGVGARCAQLCLKGVKVPQWSTDRINSNSSFRRLHFPRKAAYFSILAAESMTQCKVDDAPKCAAGFWAAASHLYSKEGNKFDGNSAYAWASLRVTVLNAMSLHGGSVSSEVATKELVQLLGAITPQNKGMQNANSKTNIKPNHQEHDKSRDTKSSDILPPPRAGDVLTPDKKDGTRRPETVIRVKNTTAPAKNPFFGQMSSQILMQQSEWMNNDPVPLLMLPLIEPSNMVCYAEEGGNIKQVRRRVKHYHKLPRLLSLDCVIHKMNFDTCVAAQKHCIAHLSKLRTSLPTASQKEVEQINQSLNLQIASSTSALQIKSAKIVKSESHLLMDKIKAAGFVGKMTTSASTFYNPYAKKQTELTGKNIITLVAQGEERTIVVKVGNNLSVPLVIPSCQLAFEKTGSIDIEAPSLSFTVPPKTKEFSVNFPFIVVSTDNSIKSPATTSTDEGSGSALHSFAINGLYVAVNNRSLYIPFPKEGNDMNLTNLSSNRQLPDPISTYQRRIKKKKEDEQFSVDLEAVPAQPNLLVSFSTAPTPLEDATTVPVHLSDGEIYTIPPFRLENDLGRGIGTMERLQVVAVGLPGLPEEILFDTDELAKALEEEEDRFSDTDSDESFDELMESDGLPPLKMKCSADGLDLESINDQSKSLGEGSILTFQIAATHDMGNQLKNGGNVRIRFRYRGPSPFPGVEIWRKREIALRIVRVKGPRISSLTFRSDLSWGSEFADLCRSLSLQRSQLEQIPNWDSSKVLHQGSSDEFSTERPPTELIIEEKIGDPSLEDAILNRIGQHSGIFVSRDDVVVLMAVANDTNSTIIFSNRLGNVGGFENSPMHTVRVTSGVSVKIPVVIPRIDCLDENGKVSDIAAELIARTALQWKSEVIDVKDKIGKSKRQGRVRIPSRCLREMIEGHKFFATRICKPPVVIDFSFSNESHEKEFVTYPGCALDVKVGVRMQEWVPMDISSKCSLTLEFACARKGSGKSKALFQKDNQGAFIWCGQARKSVQINDKGTEHCARICFLSPGDFVVSACVKICGLHGNEEIWWAPFSKFIKVNENKQ